MNGEGIVNQSTFQQDSCRCRLLQFVEVSKKLKITVSLFFLKTASIAGFVV